MNNKRFINSQKELSKLCKIIPFGPPVKVILTNNYITLYSENIARKLINVPSLRDRSDVINGEIPKEFYQYRWTCDIIYPEHKLTGIISPKIGGVSALQRLYLNRNKLTGPIPSEIGQLCHLEELRLQHNKLTGPIPSEIGQLTLLQDLFLHRNKLSGSVPSELGNLHNLTYLCIEGNNLTGKLPDEILMMENIGEISMDILRSSSKSEPSKNTNGITFNIELAYKLHVVPKDLWLEYCDELQCDIRDLIYP